MKMNFLRGLAFALATGGLLSSASAQYSGATMLPPYQQQVAYFQDAVPPPPAPPVDIQAPPAHQGSPVGSGLWGDYCSGDYGFAGCGCTTNCCGPWYGYAGGLIMTRDHENPVWLSYDTTDCGCGILTTHSADDFWGGGFETRLGRYFNDGCNAFEVAYWGLYPGVSEAGVSASDVAGDLDTMLRFDDISYDPGTGQADVSDMFFDAEYHRLRRSYQAHNVEVNLLGSLSPCYDCDQRLRFNWLAGVRYFRLDDGFEYGADPTDTTFDGDLDEIFYSADVKNHLVGFQLGGRAYYTAHRRATLFSGTTLGIFGNHIRHRSEVYGANGHGVVLEATHPNFGDAIDISTTKDDVAFLAEWAVGVNLHLSRCWSANIGYRAVALTGVALSTNQIPVDYVSYTRGLEQIDSNGSMILHGAFAGASYNW